MGRHIPATDFARRPAPSAHALGLGQKLVWRGTTSWIRAQAPLAAVDREGPLPSSRIGAAVPSTPESGRGMRLACPAGARQQADLDLGLADLGRAGWPRAMRWWTGEARSRSQPPQGRLPLMAGHDRLCRRSPGGGNSFWSWPETGPSAFAASDVVGAPEAFPGRRRRWKSGLGRCHD